MVNLDDAAGRARRESIAFLDHYYGAGAVGAAKRAGGQPVGPPAAAIATLGAFLDAGCTTVVVRFTSLDQRGQLARFVRDVAPAFQAAQTRPGA